MVLERTGRRAIIEVITLLQTIADPTVVDRALRMLIDDRQVCLRTRPTFRDRVAPALARAPSIETDDATRADLALALGRPEDPQWVPSLMAFANDDVASVRQRVASSLSTMFAGDDTDATALSTPWR